MTMNMYIIGHSIYVNAARRKWIGRRRVAWKNFTLSSLRTKKIAKEITLVVLYYSHPQKISFVRAPPAPTSIPVISQIHLWYVVLVRTARQICLAECRNNWQAGRITIHHRCAICQRTHRSKHHPIISPPIFLSSSRLISLALHAFLPCPT